MSLDLGADFEKLECGEDTKQAKQQVDTLDMVNWLR